MKLILLISVLFAIAVDSSFINPYPRFKEYRDGGDTGDPLFLTPLITANKIDEAVKAAEVTEPSLSFIKSYSGFLTVSEQFKSNMFFWYFPPTTEGNAYDPVVVWLQGGPGASSLFGLFTENGPYAFDSAGKLINRKYSWNNKHHLIYIDNPVGAGFSFTGDDAGYVKNEKEVGRDLYKTILQIFTLFPELQERPLYITGESYAGKYVPAFAYKIHQEAKRFKRLGKSSPVKINLKGIAMGNGLSDPLHQLKYGDYLYQLGLIDLNGRNEFHKYEDKGTTCIKEHDMNCAFEVFDALINMDQSPSGSLFYNLTGFKTYFNYLKPNGDDADKYFGEFIQASSTRKAIHVGNLTFHDLVSENKVEEHLKADVMDSVALWIAELLKTYKVLIYNGQLDIIVAYPLTVNYLQQLKFDGAAIYKTAPRHIWIVDGEIAGFVKEAINLIEILVRNAGHMAPADQPKWVYDMITRFTHNKPFY